MDRNSRFTPEHCIHPRVDMRIRGGGWMEDVTLKAAPQRLVNDETSNTDRHSNYHTQPLLLPIASEIAFLLVIARLRKRVCLLGARTVVVGFHSTKNNGTCGQQELQFLDNFYSAVTDQDDLHIHTLEARGWGLERDTCIWRLSGYTPTKLASKYQAFLRHPFRPSCALLRPSAHQGQMP